MPDPPAALTTTWSQVSGPPSAIIVSPSSLTTNVSFSVRTVTVNPASTNLVGNPGFEVETTGWNVSGSDVGVALSRVQGGHSGSWAGQLANGGAAGALCKLNDQPNWVRTTSAGTYTAGLWARADSPGASLTIRVRGYDGGALAGKQLAQLGLTTSWQLLSVSYVPVSAGTSTLDLQAWIASAPVGVCFHADDVAIELT